MKNDSPTCAICKSSIQEGADAIASREGEIVDYGDGPLFSVTGHRYVFHVHCIEDLVAPHVRPAGDEDIKEWVDSHIPMSERVLTVAIEFDTPGELAHAVQDGSIMRVSNCGEKTAAELASFLIEDQLLRQPPGYLSSSLFDNGADAINGK